MAGAPDVALAVVEIDPGTGASRVLRSSSSMVIPPETISRPEPITFSGGEGRPTHALFYPPANGDYAAPPGERPPLIVIGHGGPTAATSTHLRPSIQFWTSRGFAVVDVNYSGSTGYGRLYRDRLRGKWGVLDVADCVKAARALVAEGRADGRRLLVRGGSAGGYMALCALTFYDDSAAGASYYGISDLSVLAETTHKFEAHYMETLVGPYPAASQVYMARSPLVFADRIDCPIIFFQGLEDKVVPPSQAESLVEVMRRRGLRHAYLTFAGEGHGFQQADNIRRALEAELSFYAQVLGLSLSEQSSRWRSNPGRGKPPGRAAPKRPLLSGKWQAAASNDGTIGMTAGVYADRKGRVMLTGKGMWFWEIDKTEAVPSSWLIGPRRPDWNTS